MGRIKEERERDREREKQFNCKIEMGRREKTYEKEKREKIRGKREWGKEEIKRLISGKAARTKRA